MLEGKAVDVACDKVEVGRLVERCVERACRIGREVASGSHRLRVHIEMHRNAHVLLLRWAALSWELDAHQDEGRVRLWIALAHPGGRHHATHARSGALASNGGRIHAA